MSAIWGILRFDGAAVDPHDLTRMGEALVQWGTDGCSTLLYDAIGVGHRLRHVNREDRFEAQPIHDREARLTVVADMRIDNRDALIDMLGLDREQVADWPDSAFLVPGYRRWGEALPEQLIGDFTFAIWDAAARTLLLARDHMGQRGLYWHAGDDFFAFATQVDALWAVPGVPRALCDAAFARRLTMDRTQHRGATAYRDIAALDKASVLRVAADGHRDQRVYWHPAPAGEHRARDEAYYLTTYRAVLREAVRCRVERLETPPALLMSGAFDSGAIATFAGPIAARQGRKLVAVSEVLPDGVDMPLVEDAREAVEAFRVYPWIDIQYRSAGDRGLYQDLDTEFLLHGIAATTQFVERELAKIASSRGARLLMDGYGGDYTLHVRSAYMLGRLLRRGRFETFVREFKLRMRRTGQSAWSIFRSDVVGALVPTWFRRLVGAWRRGLRPVWRESGIAASFARQMIASGDLQPGAMRITPGPTARWRDFSRALINRSGRHPPPLRQTVCRAGLEFSRPFHDKRVIELAMALPDDLLFKNGLDRWLPRAALSDLLPARLVAYTGGNTSSNPGQFRILRQAVPQLLADLQAIDPDDTLARYIDLPRLEARLDTLDEARRADHRRLRLIAQTLLLGRYRLWFEGANR